MTDLFFKLETANISKINIYKKPLKGQIYFSSWKRQTCPRCDCHALLDYFPVSSINNKKKLFPKIGHPSFNSSTRAADDAWKRYHFSGSIIWCKQWKSVQSKRDTKVVRVFRAQVTTVTKSFTSIKSTATVTYFSNHFVQSLFWYGFNNNHELVTFKT